MSRITISLATTEDLHQIATLESQTFHTDPFCTVAFGPLRSSATNISRRAIQLNTIRPRDSNGQLKTGGWSVVHKAIDTKTGWIVGGAVWGFVTERPKGKDGAGEDGEEKENEEWKQENWGETAHRRFCEEVFIRGDEIMLASTKGEDYASKPLPPNLSLQQAK
jgi:hypothetical protein